MPIYSYRCTSCGNQQDILQKMSDEPLDTCLVCDAVTFKKQVTAAGFQLKGSGWYVTDFRNPAAKPAPAKADQAADQGAGDSADRAADSSTVDKAAGATPDANATKPASAAADSGVATPAKATASPAPASGDSSSAAK